ncbi:diguanylate cyclase (GGDEF) domain-containing protein [Poseidonocella sedimentorum]|uniref:Diguanylate cyclase (GGDEF) domain-containing protein n=1 Tax=Poseidonocella sedimentorum TaxID=871652 RepID=A0A1I6DYR4_9RHOB|nr:diguanylate cyclase (GGDEF) domain-containing protein [Poseidonocella sedimentorum]
MSGQDPAIGSPEQSGRERCDADIDARVSIGLLQIAYKNNLANIGVNLIAGLGVIAIIISYGGAIAEMVPWIAALTALTVIRAIATAIDLRCLHGEEPLSPKRLRWMIATYALGLSLGWVLWTALTYIAMQSDIVAVRFTALIVISALAAGATGILAPVLTIGRAYIFMMLLQGSLQLALSPERDIVLAILGIVFAIVMLVSHSNNHQVLRRSLRLQFENSALIGDLTDQRSKLEELNSSLEERVQRRTRELKRLSENDGLTGIYNRRGILDWVDSRYGAVEEGHAYLCVFIDLDRFKQINDGMDHAVGDRVLVEVANRLRVAAPKDAALCRWGGDEFVLLIELPEEVCHEAGAEFIEAVRPQVEDTMSIDGRELQVGFSAGMSISGPSPDAVRESIRSADLAMAEIKRRGRGGARYFSEELFAEQKRNFLIAQRLKHAVSYREFSLAFQPIVSARAAQVDSCEVLLRWSTPSIGPVGPDEFISIAEDTGDIVAIGEYVLDTACAAMTSGIISRAVPTVAVNVSLRQLVSQKFSSRVRSILDSHGMPASKLILEVTENIFEDRNREVVAWVLHELSDMGIAVHIDDFGTGYSSLSRLNEMPIAALKIDKSFVQNMSKQETAIIQGSVMIADRFNIETIAEGVETLEQARKLQAMGVTSLQGYFFGKPRPSFGAKEYSEAMSGLRLLHDSDISVFDAR